MTDTQTDTTNQTVTEIKRNLASADTSHYEAAKGMKELEDQGWSQPRIAAAVGCSPMTVSRHVNWLDSPEPRPSFSEWRKQQDDLSKRRKSSRNFLSSTFVTRDRT